VLIAAVVWRGGESGLLGNTGRLVGAAADVGESAGRGVSSVIDSGINISSSLKMATVAVAASGLAVATELWQGVDLTNLNVSVSAGRVAVDDAQVFLKWLQSPLAQRVWPLPDHAINLSCFAAGSIGVASPHVRLAKTNAQFIGSFEQSVVEAALLPSGYVAVSVVWLLARYDVRWANPLWGALECDAGTELDQINARLVRTLADLPDMHPQDLPLTDAALGTDELPVIISARVKRWWRACRLYTVAALFVVAGAVAAFARKLVELFWVPP
jgi:hypothetical protein